MTTGLQVSTAELRALLDPERDYGERTYEQVLADVDAGKLRLGPGHNLPQIFDTETGRTVKGTGMSPNVGSGPQHAALATFRRKALDDVDEAYRELRTGMKTGDPRFHKIFWEQLIGKVGEVRAVGERSIMDKLLEAALKPRETVVEREVIVERD
jgi:hypothetical protein